MPHSEDIKKMFISKRTNYNDTLEVNQDKICDLSEEFIKKYGDDDINDMGDVIKGVMEDNPELKTVEEFKQKMAESIKEGIDYVEANPSKDEDDTEWLAEWKRAYNKLK
jgi:hypothetical protein